MRSIGRIEQEGKARVFSEFLLVRGIRNQIDAAGDSGGWIVWVHSEDLIDEARRLLEEYRRNPDDERYASAAGASHRIREQELARIKRARARHVDMRTAMSRPRITRVAPLTILLIGASIAGSLLTRFGSDPGVTSYFSITTYETSGGYISWASRLPEIMHGELWRLFTPMFLHFGIFHLIFNMLWLKDLGTLIEVRQGPWVLLALVLAFAGLSNLGQYLASGPGFGGMSGVVYGLLGYAWMRGRFDPKMGYRIDRWIVLMMTVWFFLGAANVIPHIANYAHGVGFGAGIAWGFVSARLFGRG